MTNNIFSINLNGYDWSNLYHVDYSGGSGGEYLTELIANKAGAKATSVIKDTPEGKNSLHTRLCRTFSSKRTL